MSDDLSKDVLARLNRLEMFAGHVADWAGNALLHIKARAMLEATAQDVAEPKGLTNNETLPSDEISQPLARRMAKVIRILADCEPCGENESEKKLIAIAQAIREDLPPEAVDGDLAEVRRIVANALPEEMRPDILSGAQDHTASIQAPLACLKAGRALERDSREG